MKKLLYFFAYALYFFTPFESVSIAPNVSIVKLVSALFLMVAFLTIPKIKIPKNNFFVLFLIYTIITISSVAWSIDRIATIKISIGAILPSFIITLFLYRLVQKKEHLVNIFKSYVFGAIIAGIYALYKFFTGFRFATETTAARVTIFGQDQNELAFLLSFGIVSILYLLHFVPMKKFKKILNIISAALLSFGVLSTGSRTGFIILLAIGFVVLLAYAKKWQIIVITPIIIGLGIIYFRYLPEVTVNRLLKIPSEIQGVKPITRIIIWQMGWKAFLYERVFYLGTGFGTFPSLMFRHYNWYVAPHNTFLSNFIELGIVGFTVYISMIGVLLKKLIFLCKRESIYFSLLLLPLLIAMMTLGLEGRRWLFFIAILIFKSWQFYRIEQVKMDKRYLQKGFVSYYACSDGKRPPIPRETGH